MIQPGVVGEDGRVRPAEHVLELVKNILTDVVIIKPYMFYLCLLSASLEF